MRKSAIYFLTVACYAIAINFLQAQSIQIIPMGGYQFPAGVDVQYKDGNSPYQYARLRIKGAGNYGLGMHISLPLRGVSVTAAFTNMRSEMTIDTNFEPEEKLFDANQEYWMFGINQEVEAQDNLFPYGGLIFGWTTVRPQDSQYQNATKFSVGLEGGVKYFLNDVVGIMVHARLLLPVQWFGASFTMGTGGSGAGLTTGSSIIQGDIGGGLVIALNRQ
jgi:hypothetical protein